MANRPMIHSLFTLSVDREILSVQPLCHWWRNVLLAP